MSRAKELMAASLVPPWTFDEDGTIHPEDGPYPVIAGRIGLTPISPKREDSALIVYAVNRLPEYEAAVEALGRAANEGRNVLPDATDDQAAAIETWALTALGRL